MEMQNLDILAIQGQAAYGVTEKDDDVIPSDLQGQKDVSPLSGKRALLLALML